MGDPTGRERAPSAAPATAGTAEPLARVLGARDAAAIMVSNMIGTGILVFPGLIAATLGDQRLALAAWAAGGLVSLAGALVQAELGCRFPQAGGDYVFLREAYGRPAAFLSGWTSFVVGFPGAIALSCFAAANSLAGAAGIPKAPWGLIAIALGLLAGLSLLHARGLQLGKRLQNGLVALKLLVLGSMVVAAFAVPAAPATAAPAPAAHPFTAAFLLLLAYSGWNSAAYVAGEVREPRRTLPRALIAGVLGVTALYLAVNLAYFRVVPFDRMGDNPDVIGEVARLALGDAGGRVVSLALTFVFLGSASAMVITGPRIYWAMARDGLFPRGIAAVSPRTRTPARSLWLQSLWAAGILVLGAALTPAEKGLSDTFHRIADWTIFAIVPFAVLTTASVFVFRRRDRALARRPPFAAPGNLLTPLVFVVPALAVEAGFLVVGTSERFSGPFAPGNRENALVGCLLVASGVPAYLLWRRRAVAGRAGG